MGASATHWRAAAIMLLIAPEEVTWALSLIDEMT